MSFYPAPFDIVAALLHWLAILGIIGSVVLVTTVLTSLVALGSTGPVHVVRQIVSTWEDWCGTSFRRVWSLSVLAIRETVRRKVLYVLVVFGVLFLFAGWFMNTGSPDDEMLIQQDIGFVMKVMKWMIVIIMLLLSCFSLPEDIKQRSLHTVVTKPVRRHEIILGRILGFSLVGAGVLVVMAAVGYVWLNRQLPESARNLLVSRVPVYGKLTFKDRNGLDANEGINTGDEWMFRSYIEGNTKALAIWDFEGLGSYPVGDTFRMETSFQSFRTYKGNIEKGLMCQLLLVSPDGKLRAEYGPFEIRENRINVHDLPRKLVDVKSRDKVDIFEQLIQDGKLRVEARCLSSSQMLGMAQSDLFVRMPDRHFASSYWKGVFVLSLMMISIVTICVMASSFLKAPVALVLTVFVLLVGTFASDFLAELANDKIKSGGLLESVYRIYMHLNPVTPLDPSPGVSIIQAVDKVELKLLWAVQHLFPNFGTFDIQEYVAKGFDIPFQAAILPSLMKMIGYGIPWLIVAHIALKLRELEAK